MTQPIDTSGTTYRLSWEMVNLLELWRYSKADPRIYSHTTQTVPNREIPDEHWHQVSKETDSPFSQYDQLKAWSDADEQFVRNVRLERMASTPTWEPVAR